MIFQKMVYLLSRSGKQVRQQICRTASSGQRICWMCTSVDPDHIKGRLRQFNTTISEPLT